MVLRIRLAVITRKLVAQAALDRSRGGILPLGGIEELNTLAASADDPDEILRSYSAALS